MSNSNPKLTLEFSIEDIPWLIHSLGIAANTALMHGQQGEKVRERIKEKRAIVREFYPVLAGHDMDEYEFFNTITKLFTCKRWSVYQNKPYWWDRRDDPFWSVQTCFEKIYLVVDDVFYPVTRSINYKPELVQGLKELLDTLVPVGAEYYECTEGPVKKSKW